MNVKINDANLLIQQAEALAQIGQNIFTLTGQLMSNSNKISNSWQSDTIDKETYLKSLNQTLEKARNLAKIVHSELSPKLLNYAHQQIYNTKIT